MAEAIVNGINIDHLKGAMSAVRSDAQAGMIRFRARNRWAGGATCATTIQDFRVAGHEDESRAWPFVLYADEPKVLMGTDHGPNATEALLHALAACLGTTFIYHASVRAIKIDEMQIDLEGSLDLRGFLGLSEEVRNGYELIDVTFRVKSEASEEQIRELAELAQKRSPVFDIVTHATPVSVKAEKIDVEAAERMAAHI